ncbi:MAG: hypothetical protein ABFS02_09140 [Pseudomonadota bacterium]
MGALLHRNNRSSDFLRRIALSVICVALLSGCASVSKPYLVDAESALLKPGAVLLMKPDILLYELTAGGLREPKADWTEVAERYFSDALKTLLETKNRPVVVYRSPTDDSEKLHAHNQLFSLYEAVGSTILRFKYGPVELPTKKGRFDWTLGEGVAALREGSGAGYALFVYIRDSYASAGRIAFALAAAYFGVLVPPGSQVGFAALVDVDSGKIVWFNRMARSSGSLRGKDNAAETVGKLMEGLPL